MKLTKVAQNPIQHIMLFGPPKVGKTQLVTELTKMFNVLYIGLEQGHAVFYKLPHEQQEKVEMLLLPDSKDFPIAAQTVLKIFKKNEKGYNVCNEHGVVDCGICTARKIKEPEAELFTFINLYALDKDWVVVVDSSTQLTNSCIAHITKNQAEDYKMLTDDWGNLSKLMEIFFSRVQVAPFHTIVISHETEAELEDGKTKLVPVAGSRNFSRNSAKYFDHVVYLQVSQGKHGGVSMTTKSLNIVAGSRTDVDIGKEFSLIPFFTGQIKTQPVEVKNLSGVSNGQKAAADLTDLAAKMKAGMK
jgi:hypothetical protein